MTGTAQHHIMISPGCSMVYVGLSFGVLGEGFQSKAFHVNDS